MAFELHRFPGLPGVAASAINYRQAVSQNTGDTQRSYLPVATNNVEPIGAAAATAAAGEGISIYDHGHIVKGIAAASVGAGANVGVASTNGQFGLVTGASGVSVYRLGISQTAAAAGETLAIYVNPKQLSNLI